MCKKCDESGIEGFQKRILDAVPGKPLSAALRLFSEESLLLAKDFDENDKRFEEFQARKEQPVTTEETAELLEVRMHALFKLHVLVEIMAMLEEQHVKKLEMFGVAALVDILKQNGLEFPEPKKGSFLHDFFKPGD